MKVFFNPKPSTTENNMISSGGLNIANPDVIDMLRGFITDIVGAIRWILGQKKNEVMFKRALTEVEKVDIVIADDGITIPYGTYKLTEQEIKDLIDKIADEVDDNERFKRKIKALKDELPNLREESEGDEDDFYDNLKKKIREIAKDSREKVDKRKSYNDLINKISHRKRLSEILGEYDFVNHRIILYKGSISRWKFCRRNTYLEALVLVFAHELFHAYHAVSMKIFGVNSWNNSSNTASIVMESLAAYFEYRFNGALFDRYKTFLPAKYSSPDILEQRKHDLSVAWDTSSVEVWPYSGAKYIRSFEGNRGGLMMQYIFNQSLMNWDAALKPIEHEWNREEGYFSQPNNTWNKLK